MALNRELSEALLTMIPDGWNLVPARRMFPSTSTIEKLLKGACAAANLRGRFTGISPALGKLADLRANSPVPHAWGSCRTARQFPQCRAARHAPPQPCHIGKPF